MHAGLSYDDTRTTFQVGGVGVGPPADYGQGWRFDNVTIAGADTINAAYLRLMKSGAEWKTVAHRQTCEDADDAATFSSTTEPGYSGRALVATIVAWTNNVNSADGAVINHPTSGGDQTSYGAAIANVTGRGGWASGNAIVCLNQSDQDASAGENNSNKSYHTYDSTTGSSEPQLVIDYTAAAGGSAPKRLLMLGVG